MSKKVSCNRCGRSLSNLKSIMRGYGPICWKKISSNEIIEKYFEKGEIEDNDYPELSGYFDQLDIEYKCRCGSFPIKHGSVDHYEHLEGGYLVNGYKNRQWIFVICHKCGISTSFRKLGIKEVNDN